MASTPLFGAAGLAVPATQLTTVSVDRTGAGTYADVGSASGASGMLCWGFDFHAVGLTEDNVILIFTHDGADVRLFREVPVNVTGPSNNTRPPLSWHHYEQIFPSGRPHVLTNGDKYQMALMRAGTINVMLDAQQLA